MPWVSKISHLTCLNLPCLIICLYIVNLFCILSFNHS